MYWRLLKPKDIAAIVLAVGLFVLLGYVYVSNATRKANSGFGPEWDCTPQPRGDPVCIKKAPTDEPSDGGQGSGRAAQP